MTDEEYNETFDKCRSQVRTLKEIAMLLPIDALEYVCLNERQNATQSFTKRWHELCTEELAERILLGPDDGDN